MHHAMEIEVDDARRIQQAVEALQHLLLPLSVRHDFFTLLLRLGLLLRLRLLIQILSTQATPPHLQSLPSIRSTLRPLIQDDSLLDPLLLARRSFPTFGAHVVRCDFVRPCCCKSRSILEALCDLLESCRPVVDDLLCELWVRHGRAEDVLGEEEAVIDWDATEDFELGTCWARSRCWGLHETVSCDSRCV